MAWLLIMAVIAVPVVEIAVFIKTAQLIGLGAAVLLALLAGVVGVILVRAQGLRTMMRAKELLDHGQMPVAEMFDGLCVAVAGGLLILPGFLSDAVALLLLAPPVRAVLRGWIAARLVVVRPATGGPGGQPPVIDGEYRVVDHDPPVSGPDQR